MYQEYFPILISFQTINGFMPLGLGCLVWYVMVPTGTGNQGKPGKMGRLFPVREFCEDWKSPGILLKILEKLEKFILEN